MAKRINVNHIHQFYQSPLGQLVVTNAEQTKREVPFSLLMPAQQIFTGFETD